jgi:hypothetical protein
MLSVALIVAKGFVLVTLYNVNIFAYKGYYAITYLGGFNLSLAFVAKEHDVYKSM